MGTESEGLGTQYLEANTEMRRSAFSRAESAAVPFEDREGIEGEHTPETDLTRHHQAFEEEDKFESSILRLNRCCFEVGEMLFSGSPVRGHTLVGFME